MALHAGKGSYRTRKALKARRTSFVDKPFPETGGHLKRTGRKQTGAFQPLMDSATSACLLALSIAVALPITRHGLVP